MNKNLSPLIVIGTCVLLSGGCVSQMLGGMAGNPVSSYGGGAVKIVMPQGATNFTSKEGRFSIYFPSKPKLEQSNDKTVLGNLQTILYTSDSEDVSYIVGASKLPARVGLLDPAAIISGVQSGFLGELKAKAEKSRAVMRNGVPGREIESSMLSGAVMIRLSIYASPTTAYQVITICRKDDYKRNQAQIEKVIASFRIDEPNKPPLLRGQAG